MILQIAKDLGTIKNIELTEAEDAIEFWIIPTGSEDSIPHAYFLFNYTSGVVEI